MRQCGTARLLAAMSLLSVACTTGAGVSGPYLPVWEDESPEGEGAEMRGELAGDGSCVWVSHGDSREAVVWPDGTTTSPSGVTSRDGTTVEFGELVVGSGGSRAIAPDARCGLGDETAFYLNSPFGPE